MIIMIANITNGSEIDTRQYIRFVERERKFIKFCISTYLDDRLTKYTLRGWYTSQEIV